MKTSLEELLRKYKEYKTGVESVVPDYRDDYSSEDDDNYLRRLGMKVVLENIISDIEQILNKG